MQLDLGHAVLDLDQPRVMGILNVTPDSFSDGGRFFDPAAAIAHAESMIAAGADIIDIGGESTRPGAAEVSIDDELARILPVIRALAGKAGAPISVDTSKPEVMVAAAEAGASMINDVYALRQPGAIAAASGLDVPICLMHMLGMPSDMQVAPRYDKLPGDVIDFLRERIAACEAGGILRDRLLVDPGFGFGKNDGHNLEIIAKLDRFAELGLPLLVGLSRKHTLGKLTGRSPGERQYAGIAAATIAVLRGAHIVRTHDVAATVDALKIAHAVMQVGKDE
jgi:dihydropteroate synthase